MLKKKEVKLAKGAWIKQIDDWKIVPRIIPSQEEIELTDEETKTSN
jgi:sulfur relay (sulfurtransferase) DsrC/TusE family protein